MERKLQKIIDRQEIWQVLQRYARGLDRMDVELARSCYFEDAIDDHGHFVGYRDDFIDMANKSSLNFVEQHHGIMNHSCELHGDNAYCETYYLFTGLREAPPHLMTMGRYIDDFQRRNGEWCIANRVKIHEGAFDLQECSVEIKRDHSHELGQGYPAARDRNDISYHRPPVPRQPIVKRKMR